MQAVSEGIVRCAQDDDTLFNLIGGRIQRAEDPTTSDITLPAIVFQFIPGRVKYPVQGYYIYNIHVLVYSSKSYRETEQIYTAFMGAMDNMLISHDDTNFHFRAAQAPSSNYIEEQGNFVLSVFWTARAVEP